VPRVPSTVGRNAPSGEDLKLSFKRSRGSHLTVGVPTRKGKSNQREIRTYLNQVVSPRSLAAYPRVWLDTLKYDYKTSGKSWCCLERRW
jgi:hypothetical protein